MVIYCLTVDKMVNGEKSSNVVDFKDDREAAVLAAREEMKNGAEVAFVSSSNKYENLPIYLERDSDGNVRDLSSRTVHRKNVFGVTDEAERKRFIAHNFAKIPGKKPSAVDFIARYNDATRRGLTVAEIGQTFAYEKTAEQVVAIAKRERDKLVVDTVARFAAKGKTVSEDDARAIITEKFVPMPIGAPEAVASGSRARAKVKRANWLDEIAASLD